MILEYTSEGNPSSSLSQLLICHRGSRGHKLETIGMKWTMVKLRGQAMQIMRPELDEIRQEMQDEGISPAAIGEGQERMNMVFKKHGVSMFTTFKMLFIQLPVFISLFLAIENMTTKVPSFKLWILRLLTVSIFFLFLMRYRSGCL